MGRKQLKIALSEDFFQELNKEARKHKIPVSTFARSLIAAGLKGSVPETEKPSAVRVEPQTKQDDVILLSDVLAGADGSANHKTTKTINPDGKTPVSIQIIFNN